MKRRNFLAATFAGIISTKLFAQPSKSVIDNPPKGTSADPKKLPPITAPNAPTQWKNYDLKLTIKTDKNLNSIWIPLPMIQTIQNNLYQKLLQMEITGNFSKQSIFHNYENNYHILNTNYENNSENTKNLTLNLTIQTADRKTDFSKRNVSPERIDILKYYLEDSELIPNDKLARSIATKIVNRIKDPIAQARTIFDWIVEHSTYEIQSIANITDNKSNNNNNIGNVRQLLQNQNQHKDIKDYHFSGRSAELNGLFVSLCRSIGIPARSVCGQRIAKSKLLPCLGIEDDNKATDLQHTRAEFYSPGCGWIPIDVSDVKRAEYFKTSAPELKMLQTLLFGFWEMNWFAFGFGNEVILNNNNNYKISFFDKAVGEGANKSFNSQWINFDNTEISIEAIQQI